MGKTKPRRPRPPKPNRRATPKPPRQGKTSTLEAKLDRAREALRRGQPDDAFTACREALATEPKNPDALSLAGVAAFHAGFLEDALGLLQAAVSFAPGNAEAQTNFGNVLAHKGEVEAAAAAYRQAIDTDPSYLEAFFNFGALMAAISQPYAAIKAFERVLELSPEHTLARQGLGNALKTVGRLDAARAAYESVLGTDPSIAEARTNLAAVLQESGEFEAAADHCRHALGLAPQMIEARYNLGIALQELGRFEEAIAAYEKVLVGQPGHAAAALNIAYAHQQLGDLDAVTAAIERTIAVDPDFAMAHANLADLKLQQSNPAAALDVCESFLASHPGNTDLLAFKAIALVDAGDRKAAGALVDFKRFIRLVKPSTPAGYDSLDAFNAALQAHLRSHPTLTYAPQSHATRNGHHTGELLDESKGPIRDLEVAIRDAVAACRSDFGIDPNHPFLTNPPESLGLSIWGVVMGRAGHQIAHIHPAAWLSGVYYVRVPEAVYANDVKKAGWIEFGRPPAHFHNRTAPETQKICPEPGLMVLFPSYFYHNTIPYQSAEARISIAFDLIP